MTTSQTANKPHGSALQREEWKTTVVLGLLSLAIRLYVAIGWAGQPVWDGHYYDFGAKRIAGGFGYSDEVWIDGVARVHPWCHYPVGYSGFLAGIYKVFGSSLWVAPVTNAVVGALIVMLTHRIGLFWLTRSRALIAAILCAASAELILYTPVVMTELTATMGPMLAIWLMLVFRRSRPRLGATVCGLVTGLMTLVQPQLILFAPFLGALCVKPKPLSFKWIIPSMITTVVALAVVAPWTYRNCRVMDGCAFVSTNGGWNLAIGAVPKATGRFVTLRASDGCAVVTGQVRQDKCWAKVGIKAIQNDIGRWLMLAPRKLGECFDHASFPVEYLAQTHASAWPENRRQIGRGALSTIHRVMLTIGAFAFIALGQRIGQRNKRQTIVKLIVRFIVEHIVELVAAVLTATLAVWAWAAQSPIFWPLSLSVVVTALWPRSSMPKVGAAGSALIVSWLLVIITHVIFFGEDRYHVRLIPIMCLFVAAVGRNGGTSASLPNESK